MLKFVGPQRARRVSLCAENASQRATKKAPLKGATKKAQLKKRCH